MIEKLQALTLPLVTNLQLRIYFVSITGACIFTSLFIPEDYQIIEIGLNFVGSLGLALITSAGLLNNKRYQTVFYGWYVLFQWLSLFCMFWDYSFSKTLFNIAFAGFLMWLVFEDNNNDGGGTKRFSLSHLLDSLTGKVSYA